VRVVDKYVNAIKNARHWYWWKYLDRPILEICKDHPEHVKSELVFAKVALINRVYRTNLQMGSRDAEQRLADKLVAAKADRFISALTRIQTFDRRALPSILAVHETFVRLAYRITGRVENSFCSKYLSFHYPASVLIFDNYAYAALKAIRDSVPRGLYPRNWNRRYAYHCEAVLILLDELRDRGINRPNLKLVDHVLYGDR